MRLHEYQAKEVFADAGLPVPDADLADTVDDAVAAAERIGVGYRESGVGEDLLGLVLV